MNVISIDKYDPYNQSIRQFIMGQFPYSFQKTSDDVLELVFSEVLGTKHTRYGPKPMPEVQVNMRDVIRYYIGEGKPIPFMVPWGSEKPDGSGVDIAEIAALKTLSCLGKRIKEVYPAGAVFNIRIEDVSAPHLFVEDMEKARREANFYSTAFVNLIQVLGIGEMIHGIRESSLIDEPTFNAKADEILPAMEEYVREVYFQQPTNKFEAVKALGWAGEIAPDTLRFYMGQYDKMYADKGVDYKLHKLARYFSGALARTVLKIRGDAPEWGGKFLDLSFAENPPGTNLRFGRRIIYRTLPDVYTSSHIPAWRGKGYLLIDEDGVAVPKLTTFRAAMDMPFNKQTTKLEGGGVEVVVQTDYILKEEL